MEGVTEVAWMGRPWKSAYRPLNSMDGVLLAALRRCLACSYRYRVGRRAVILWPESRMGEVVEIG